MSTYVSCVKNSVSTSDYSSALSITGLAAAGDPMGVHLMEVMVEEMPRFDTQSVMKVRDEGGRRREEKNLRREEKKVKGKGSTTNRVLKTS
jgi:hypothetical protein